MQKPKIEDKFCYRQFQALSILAIGLTAVGFYLLFS
jgi:hypothetical protein